MFWPHIIPYPITVGNISAQEKSISFLFWGAGVFLLAAIAIYTVIVYWLFCGRLSKRDTAERRRVQLTQLSTSALAW